ncbi:hypothetical protein GKS24_07685 [Streptococcus uberis]|uniref:Uncharacterized protein n=1 Tax=Streptococcus uberis TaxID=1349 RepID=A0A6L6G8A8_STRUB|nr:hypothetical protein [Streptococcus uberis]MCK1234992.1 hypothetical protein [Streptococcus uberis]MTB78501.1 hypothetical protein [Streptococcus uberis]MTC85274.1 hypothetical protein [Streptococcus uberis]MTC86750.1 hypothetical protein [Streptococcus uberis]MTD01642.1 hypothetical protein [Streptococcus uberis]
MEQKAIASYSILCVELEELLDVIELGLDDGTPNKMAATLNVVEMALKGIISVHQENIKVMEKIDKEF